MILPPVPAWHDDALCAQTDPDAFFPEVGTTSAVAKRVCMGCPVRRECLEHAVTHGENVGVWGGTTPNQRKAIRRARDERKELAA
ncbi:WhiB family transcriptional regulator [Streptomyces sp. NPDC019507]|uniref:WhiB family transcriptional regulator n=1 Tax=Streptomyces sp. NPDC019507 TaxID=3154689 RepID=UPI0033F5D083